MSSELGSLSVLNVGAGDIRVTFNRDNTDEVEKALSMLRDMQSRGYAIMIELPDHTYVRATSIDASTASYVVVVNETSPLPDDAVVESPQTRAKRGRRVRVPVRTSRAVGIARSAGG